MIVRGFSMKYKSRNLLQINELVEEVSKETLNIPKILKLFKELFEDLVAITTAWKCVEIDQFCTALVLTEEIHRLPLGLEYIVDYCTALHDYPAEFCWVQPEELLDRINELCKELHVDIQSIKTKKDRIIEMYDEGTGLELIAEEVRTDQDLVMSVLIRAGYRFEAKDFERMN